MANQPNVLLVVPRMNIGGAETYVHTLAIGLQQRGYKVVVASWGGLLADDLQTRGITHYRIPIRLNAYIASLFLERIVKKEQIAMIHANSADAGCAVAELHKRTQVPWVFTAHGVFGNEVKNQGIQLANRIVCVSDFLLQQLVRNTGLEREKFITIYNGVDVDKFNLGIETSIDRTSLGISLDEFVIGIVSRITDSKGKGHEDLLQVLAKYEFAKRWRLLIIGKGRYQALREIKNTARKLGVFDRIIFAGHHMQIAPLLAVTDVVALPSKWETFGLVLAEGMAMEKPVVAYRYAGMIEVIEDGVTGYLAEYENLDDLADKLRLCSHSESAKTMGKLARKRVEQMFNKNSMVDKIIELYKEVLMEKSLGKGGLS